jgi:hypothetical protein
MKQNVLPSSTKIFIKSAYCSSQFGVKKETNVIAYLLFILIIRYTLLEKVAPD